MPRIRLYSLALPLLLACASEAPKPPAQSPTTPLAKVVERPCDKAKEPVLQDAPLEQPSTFTMIKAMVPMRDGVRLQTVIFAPKDTSRPLPMLFERHPYGVPDKEDMFHSPVTAPFVADGYIWVFQNLRGRFESEGTFVMDRPPRDPKDPKAIDEATDAYDTIEWLLKNVPANNGKVGMFGTSYAGQTATQAELLPHPALKAIVAAASPADQFLGDDFHHNGAFRLAYGFEYVALLESGKVNTSFGYDRGDIYDFYLALGPLSNADKRYFHGKMPTWNDFVAHPNYDAHWQRVSFNSQLSKATVPILHVAGWWDQEDFYGPLRNHALFEKNDTERKNFLVAGPWNHGGWYSPGRTLGKVDFGTDTGEVYRTKIWAPFFRYHLHGKGTGDFPEATVFETGSNQWRSFASWPPQQGITTKKLYLREGFGLSFEPPKETGNKAADSYVSDPQNPVPYQPRPIAGLFTAEEWPVWQAQDQRFASHRPDVLEYATDVLTEDVTVAGDVSVELYAATSGTDSDWVVRLIDVFPEGPPAERPKGQELGPPPKDAPPDMRGFQLMIDGDVLRGRFRESFEKPKAITKGKIEKYAISLHSHSHVFKKGHRILLAVQSSWFPVIDRNPQTFVSNIFEAKEADFVKTTQTVSRSKEKPSAIVLPILTAPASPAIFEDR